MVAYVVAKHESSSNAVEGFAFKFRHTTTLLLDHNVKLKYK